MNVPSLLRCACLIASSISFASAASAAGEALAHAEPSRRLDAPSPPATVTAAPTSAEPRRLRRSYGWQTAAVDGAALVTFVLAAELDWHLDPPSPLLTTSLALYGLGAPLVHVTHGRPHIALASLGLRAVVPPACGLGAWTLTGGPWTEGWEALLPFFVGVLGGTAGLIWVIGFDAAVLSEETVVAEPSNRTARRSTPSLRLVPQTDVHGAPAGLALGGTLP